MPLDPSNPASWCVAKIGVIGPGIVGMPMAALLADARIREGREQPARVLVVQRASPTSAWKVEAINAGRSPIGGIEPDLDAVIARSVRDGLLGASPQVGDLGDADVVLVCVQTDKSGIGPDYGPMLDALNGLAAALRNRPAGNLPLVIIESTLAPSSMATVVRDLFARHGLIEGKDVLLGNSPNRVMPGRLVERVAAADKIVAGLRPLTTELITRLYRRIVTGGILHRTNSLTAEVVKTLENAYRDVRIAFSSEVARYCDARDISFYQVRRQVNDRLAQSDAASADPNAVPTGGLLVPTIGVGGHCLPKDGILLWWRLREQGEDDQASLILEARRINDESPAETIRLAERGFGPLAKRRVALLGTAYRFNSEDTRNSPALPLARLLLDRGCEVRLHDPYVYPHDQNLARTGLTSRFTRDLDAALADAEYAVMCTAHRVYLEEQGAILGTPGLRGIMDGCNLYRRDEVNGVGYSGIGRGELPPSAQLVDEVEHAFIAMERGMANEVKGITDYLNRHYAADAFTRIDFAEVQRLAGTCVTGCKIVDPGPVTVPPRASKFQSRLVECAATAP